MEILNFKKLNQARTVWPISVLKTQIIWLNESESLSGVQLLGYKKNKKKTCGHTALSGIVLSSRRYSVTSVIYSICSIISACSNARYYSITAFLFWPPDDEQHCHILRTKGTQQRPALASADTWCTANESIVLRLTKLMIWSHVICIFFF